MHRSRARLVSLVLLGWLAGAHAPTTAQPVTLGEFSVHAGGFERIDTPVSAGLDGVPLSPGGEALSLVEITGGSERTVPFQIEAGVPSRLLWILDGRTPPGRVRTFALRTGHEGPRAPAAIRVDDDGSRLTLRSDGRDVLSYQYAVQRVPEGVDPVFERSGFIHPLWSPEGEVLTRIQPPDHWHHYGLWNPWTSTDFEGRQVDFWNLAGRQGTVRAGQVLERVSGPVAGGFRAALDHVAFDSSGGETVALNEQWSVDAWNVGSGVWLVDFSSTLSPASDEPLTIKAYRYQGFSLRATAKWNDQTARLRSSEGFGQTDGNGTRARWLDVNGVSDTPAGRSGIVFMTHPGNFNFPEHLRIWPPDQNSGVENVFINFNPAQDRDLRLVPGRTYAFRYRLLVYDGAVEPDAVERYWRDFADPPRVTVHPVGTLAGAHVLVYTRNGEGYVHENIPYGVAALEKLGAEHGFQVSVSDDPSIFTPDVLARFDAIIFANSNNEAFTSDAQRAAFQAYIRGGGGFMGIHSASGSERDWPWYSALLGGNFVRHAPQQDFTVVVVDGSHPSTSFLPDRWEIRSDECYYHDELNPGIRVLLAADLATVEDTGRDEFPGTLFGDRYPLAWYQEFDGGRQWFTALGHRPETYSDPLFLRHLLGGIQWVVDRPAH